MIEATTKEGAALWWLLPLGVIVIVALAYAAVTLFQRWFNR